MEYLELSVLALAPVVFLITYIYLKDKYEREPLKYLIITFILGAAIAYPVILLGTWLQNITETTYETDIPEILAVYAFLVVAFPEEWLKYLVLRWYNYPHREFDEPYDGIMYGAVVSLGFATVENFLYLFTTAGNGVELGLLRMFTAVPAHAAFGVIMGYFVGRAKFLEGNENPFLERMKGLGLAILLHGLYDYFLFLGENYWAIFSFALLGLGLIFSRRAMMLHSEQSPYKPDEETADGGSIN